MKTKMLKPILSDQTLKGEAMKSRKLLLIAFILIAGVVSSPAPQFGDLTYESSGTEITITGYTGPGGDITIPVSIEGLPVTSIGQAAFLGCPYLTSVDIPDTVTSIEGGYVKPNDRGGAFAWCMALSSVRLPNNLVRVDGFTFYGCINLTSAVIPGSVRSIEEGAFGSCISLTNVTMGTAVTNVGHSAFYGCTSLPNVTIPSSVTSIGGLAFAHCSSLTNVTIPASVTSIGESAFARCESLTAFQVDTPNPAYTSLDGVLFNKDQTTLIQFPAGRAGSYSIPEAVTRIAPSAFEMCGGLTSIMIPEGVTVIPASALYMCTGLTSVTIPNSVAIVEGGAFAFCWSLTNVVLGSGVTIIEGGAFGNCTRLASIIIPDSVTSIEGGAFSDCSSLSSLSIGQGVAKIGNEAFRLCSSISSVTIPDSVTEIGYNSFSGCTSLTNVTIGVGVTNIGSFAFAHCTSLGGITVDALNPSYASVEGVLFDKSRTTLIQYPGGRPGSYTIPNGVTRISHLAFKDCINLTSVRIPDGVVSLEFDTFGGCLSLTAVSFPKSFASIELGTFFGCTNLMSFEVDSLNPVYSSLDGVLLNKQQTEIVLCPHGKAGIYSVPESVLTIRDYAFAHCINLTGVEMNNSLTNISMDAFSGCTNLTNITIPSSVTSIGSWAFADCTSLTNVTVGAGVTSIGLLAFTRCTNLSGFEVDSLNPAFTSLDGVLFNKDLTILVQYPGGKVGSYVIPNGVTRIAPYAFASCLGLTDVMFDSNLTSIGECAFWSCSGLTHIEISSSVTNFGSSVFSDCWRLAGVYFGGNPPLYEWHFFVGCPAAIVYYRLGTIGWGPTFDGRPTALWIEPPVYADWVQTTALPTQFPNASGEADDPDQDGMSNYAEMLAATSPTDRASSLVLEIVPRQGDLSAADKIPIGVTQHALFFRSVPGKSYGVQWAPSLDGPWNTTAVVTATTTQKRLVFEKPETQAFYRVILAQ